MNTNEYRTRTRIIERKNVQAKKTWGIALDIGYSAVKGFAPNKVYCFPSYAKQVNTSFLGLGSPMDTDIIYRDTVTKEEWIVGAMAQNMIETDDSNDSANALYGRNRYYSQMFKVIARVGIAMGMMKNEFGDPYGKNLKIQTGLPPAYLKSDTPMLKDVLSGTHEFELKIGKQPWRRYKYHLPEDNIAVMPQPMGTLLSIATNNDGKFIPEAKDYFQKSLLIIDPGFGTLDSFSIKNRMVTGSETFDNLGMKSVLKATADEIFNRYQVEIPIPAMQKYLETGEVKKFDRQKRSSTKVSFDSILEKESSDICRKALEKLDTIYNNLIDYEYLVITGGTGAAWENMIIDYYSAMDGLKVVRGTQNDDLEYIFANVRGYYMYLQQVLAKQEGQV